VRALVLTALVLMATGAATPSPHWSVTDPGQGPVSLPQGDTPARELGGIT
jgi:hypothetical protein